LPCSISISTLLVDERVQALDLAVNDAEVSPKLGRGGGVLPDAVYGEQQGLHVTTDARRRSSELVADVDD